MRFSSMRAHVAVAVIVLAAGPASAADRPVWPSLTSAMPADASAASASPAPLRPGAVAPADVANDPNQCGLLVPGSERATSGECLACHARLSHGGHAYDLPYPRWVSAPGAGSLRPLEEVMRRGLSLPDQQIRCITCHDGASPWKYRIKLPPGATVTWAVDLRRRETYEKPERLPAPRAGDDVGKKPLCLACHSLD